MLKKTKLPILVIMALTLSVMVLGADAFAKAGVNTAGLAVGTGNAVSTNSSAPKTIDMSQVPQATASKASSKGHATASPFLTGTDASTYAQRKASALHSSNVAKGSNGVSNVPTKTNLTNTPTATTTFAGMSDSAATCPYFGGCEPPDQALAASFSWVMQGVNTSFAVYNTAGALQPGWPKNAQNFFGIPSPGACDPNGPFLSDPRAFFDQNDNRFWVAMLQVEGAFGLNSCPFQTTYWIAVSANGNPNGAWHVYGFNMALGTTNVADYTEFGFDQQAIYFSGNMFNQAGSAYMYSEMFGARKHVMENGQAVTGYGFAGMTVGGVAVDTVQPSLGESLQVGGALGGQFINSFNINFGGGQCFSGCSGITVWSMSNPGFSTTSLSGLVVSTAGYSLAPNASEPGSANSIETLDTRISGTPVWQRGMLTFALETNVNNGVNNVPGIFWGQVFVALNDNGSINSASMFQQGYYFYSSGVGSGDTAASFGAVGADGDGDLFMVFEFMGSSFNPSVVYTSRRSTLALGAFHDGGIYLQVGAAPTFDSRWGDYEAVSPGAVPFTNDIWFSGQYSNASGDWSTFIGHDKFVAGAS